MNTPSNRLNLGQLKIQAKELLRAANAGESDAIERVLPYFKSAQALRLAQAQLVIARENGFDRWTALKRQCEPAPLSRTAMLFSAIESDKTSIALNLLAESPELAASWQRTEWGWASPLHVAAKLGRLAICQALIDAGAVVYAVNQGDYPPVFDAIYYKHTEVANLLMETSAKTDGGQPPTFGCGIDIILAGRLGMLDRVQMHVERDPFAIYRRGCIGESVLHWPAHNGHVEILAYLLDKGTPIEVDEIGLYGGKPLHWASEHAPRCVEALVSRGANPNARNLMKGEFEGFTPLHMMARQRQECVECAEMLLQAGADPLALDALGRTPLDIAKEGGRSQVIAFLSRYA